MGGRTIESFIKWLNSYNPTRSYLLDQFKLDKRIVRAEGHWLFEEDGSKYLDFLSQYGAVSFGHNHPELTAALSTALAEQLPALGQPFVPTAAQDLADRLKEMCPGELAHTVFANSGAEAVEAAIKLARAKTGRRVVLSATDAFHGKTLGALSATHQRAYQEPFGAPVPGFEAVPFGDLDALDERLSRKDDPVAAFLIEPIQGEGGVVPAPDGYLAAARALCHQHGTLFVVDEIQTGLGRTGALWGLPPEVGAPDVLLLGKALGGGLFPIAACVCTPKVWDHEFGYRHSSTFAGNNLGCRVGMAVLELLERDDGALIRQVEETGRHLMAGLQGLAQRYPRALREARGRGLLAAVELQPFRGEDSYAMSYFSSAEYLIAVLAGHLLNEYGIVTAPVFNNSNVLRLEPPFTVGHAEVDRVLAALDDVCDAIERRDYQQLLRFLIDAEPLRSGRQYGVPNAPNPKPSQGSPSHHGRFSFLFHLTRASDIAIGDPSFDQWGSEELDRWCDFVADSEAEEVYWLEGLESPTGAMASGSLIVVPMLPDQILRRGRRKMIPLLKDAIRVARDGGARVVGLGGFTSIVSKGGELLKGGDLPVTSGSSLTALVIRDGIMDVMNRLGRPLGEARVAILGGAGAIGRLCALLLAPRVGGLVLVGNAGTWDGERRVQAVAAELLKDLAGKRGEGPDRGALAAEVARLVCLPEIGGWPVREGDDPGAVQELAALYTGFRETALQLPLEVTTRVDDHLAETDIVIAATSSRSQLLEASALRPGTVICDAGRPQTVGPEIAEQRPDVLVFEGGLVDLPQPVHFGPNLVGFPPGTTLACLAESMLMALEGDYTDHSIGQSIPLEEVLYFETLAERHGFRTAAPHWQSQPISAAAWQRFLESQQHRLETAAG